VKNALTPIVDAAKLVVKSPAVMLINLFVTALLGAGAIFWLTISDAKVSQLVLGSILALVLILSWWWLDAGTAAYMYRASRGDVNVRDAYKQGIRRAVLFGIVAVIWILLWLCAENMRDFGRDLGSLIYSKLSAANRGRVGYQGVHSALDWVISFKQWFLLTAVMLPWVTMLSGAALTRESAKDALRTYKRLGYWLGVIVVFVVAVWIPAMLLSLRFGSGLEVEMVSMIIRFALAYIFFIAGWLFALALSATASRPDAHAVVPATSAAVSG
jgi:hypothetical protein